MVINKLKKMSCIKKPRHETEYTHLNYIVFECKEAKLNFPPTYYDLKMKERKIVFNYVKRNNERNTSNQSDQGFG